MKCPGGSAELFYTNKDNEVCSGHGVCRSDSGRCQCDGGFRGVKCLERTCPYHCSGQGTCNTRSGRCLCNDGYDGAGCHQLTCTGGCGGSAGTCDTSSGLCICSTGFSGPQCKPTTACDVEDTTFDNWAMFRTGWSKCKDGWLMTGWKRGACSGLHCIDNARCARPCLGQQRLPLRHCYQANWWDVLNKAGVATCAEGHYMAGVYRSNCLSLYCLQMALCCSVEGSEWDHCGTKDWSSEIQKPNSWAVVPSTDAGDVLRPLGFMTGVERAGITATVDDLHRVNYCSFKQDA